MAKKTKEKPKVIAQTKDFLAVNKPCGLPTIPIHEGGISLKSFFPKTFPVHRLDTETSGVIILAKNKRAADFFIGEFQKRRIKKFYLGLSSTLPKRSRYQEKWKDLLEKTSHKVRPVRVSPKGKEAITHTEIFDLEGKSLLFFQPKTGRTHQLRVQSGHHGYPLIGDQRYGLKEESFLYLHALGISFRSLDQKEYFIGTEPTHWRLSGTGENLLRLIEEKIHPKFR